MTNIKPRQAWRMALSLFNGVVKSGYGEKTPFRRGVSECDSIKILISMRSDVQTFVLRSFGKPTDSWQLPFCWQLFGCGTHSVTERWPFFNLWVMLLCSRERRSRSTVPVAEALPGLLLSLGRLANSLTNCDPAEWKSGEQGNVNRVQLGFVPCLFPANRLSRIPTLTYWNER